MGDAPDRGYALAIGSGKGGVGKTTTAINLGATLAQSDYDVVIVDVDLGMANLGTMVGLTTPTATLHDVLAGRAPLKAAMHEGGDLTVVPGSTVLDHFADADTTTIDSVVEDLKSRFDIVILDVGAGLSADIAKTLEAADGVLLVTTAELPSLNDASKTGELVERLDVPVVGAVFTGTGEGPSRDVEEIATALGTTGSVTVSVPADKHVLRSVRKGMPVVYETPKAPASRAYRRLAATLETALEFESEEETEFEWVDPTSGESTDGNGPDPVMEVPLETLIEEAGLKEPPTAETDNSAILDRVRALFGE